MRVVQNPARESDELFKIQQERAMSYSKSSNREREMSYSKSSKRESDTETREGGKRLIHEGVYHRE